MLSDFGSGSSGTACERDIKKMMRSTLRTLRACRPLATRPLATRAAAPASRGLAAAAAAAGAAALYYSSSTAHAESAAAAKTRFDADGFGSPSFKGDVVIVTEIGRAHV